MVVAIGFFDGVHTGHREIISRLVGAAHERGCLSTVITFWPHPRTVLRQEARSLRLLTSLEEKTAMLRGLGVDKVEILPFTRTFSSLTTEQFLREYVIGRYGASAIVLGYDNRIGSDCASPDHVAAVAESLGLEVIGVPAFGTVSSTKIRRALEEGRLADAEKMLGYVYALKGVVVSGNRMGRTIGFPTANLQLYEPLKLVPADGVYAVRVDVQGREYGGMCNIGRRPTVSNGNFRTIETNIFDFEEEIYGLDLSLQLVGRVRDEVKFSDLESLALQLGKDREICRKLLNNSLLK